MRFLEEAKATRDIKRGAILIIGSCRLVMISESFVTREPRFRNQVNPRMTCYSGRTAERSLLALFQAVCMHMCGALSGHQWHLPRISAALRTKAILKMLPLSWRK